MKSSGSVLITEFTSTFLSVIERWFVCPPDNLVYTLVIKGMKSYFRSFLTDISNPKYLNGKQPYVQLSIRPIVLCSSHGTAIGTNSLLCMFICNPMIWAYVFSTCIVDLNMLGCTSIMICVSSANYSIVFEIFRIAILKLSLDNRICNVSVMSTKRRGDNGSHWRNPLMW
jgi:hypothetical protein